MQGEQRAQTYAKWIYRQLHKLFRHENGEFSEPEQYFSAEECGKGSAARFP
jgi:hypothetical protein